jgi:hypothetical protein
MSTEITITSTTIDINVSEYPITIEAPSGAYPLPTSVYSVFGRTGNVVAAEGDYTLTQLAGVTITSPVSGQALVYNGTSWVNNTETFVGTVTSVAATVPTGLTITGSPITTSGTLAFGLQAGYSIPTTAKQTTWDTAYNDSIVSAAVTGTSTKTLTLNQQDGGTVTANWSDLQPVTSVFGRTGDVVAANNDYTTTLVTEGTNLYYTQTRFNTAFAAKSTTDLAEGTNLYYTDVRARASNSFVAGSGAYNSTTGVITIPTNNNQITNGAAYITLTGLSASAPLSYNNTTGAFSISQANTSTDGYLSSFDWNTFNNKQIALTFGNLTSSDITVTGGTGSVIGTGSTLTLATVNTNTGTFGSSTAIPVITVNGKGLITALTTTAVSIPSGSLSFIGDVTGTGTTGSDTTLTLATVNTNVGAYGSSTSVPTITVNAKGLVTAASQTAIPTATSSVNGLLTSTDWSTFNGKQNQLNGTGFVKVTGTTVSYDNNTYLTTIEGIAAGGELSGTYASPSLVNSAVTGKILTGVNITGGTIADTDSILTAFGKVQNQINGLIGGSIYKGTWNASTNTPALASGVGVAGNYYIVSVAGTTNLDGITDWQVGDWVIYQGTEWEKVDNTDAVVSVNGFTGAVSLTTSNISEGTNLYYTDTRARASISGSTGISYNSTSGVITNSAPDQTVSLTASTGISTSGTYPSFTITNTAPDQTVTLTSGTGISATGTYPNFTITNTAPDQTVALTQGGTTTITGTYPNFTISSADQYVGTVTSIGITESSDALSITGSPITTSGNINIGFAGSPTQYVAGDGSLVTFPTIITQAQNLVAEVYNNTGATLTRGTIVYINGGQGNLPTVTKAIATSDATSAQTFGLITANLTNNNNGYVTIIGRLENMDTQAYANGTQLYLSGTTAGTYTSTKPQAPIHLVYVAIVVRSHPTQGVLEVKIQNGEELSELHDVQVISIANNNILQYSSADSLWHNVAGTTTNIAEGTNLYYTDTRARASISTTATGLTYTSGTGVLSLTAGYVIPTTTSATEWDTAYTNRITSATSPLSITSNVISIAQATTSTNGYLSSTDWTTFNNKQATLSLTTTGSSGAATLVSNVLNVPTYTLTGLGGVPTTRTLTINGTGYDLSADRSWTIPTSVNATFTQDYTATAAQTTFTVTGGYTVGQLAVYYNGSKLASAEFTASNGTTFVLATACQVNDIVQAVVEITGGGIGGSGTTNYVSKFTASGVLGNSLIFDNGTSVGIGTNIPDAGAPFTIDKTGAGLQTLAYFQNQQAAAADTGTSLYFLGTTGLNSLGRLVNAWEGASISSSYMAFWTRGGGTTSEKLRITSAGNVGIGTSNPTGRLMLYSTGNVFQNIVSLSGGSTQVGINLSPSMTDTEVAANPAQASIYATDSNYGANIIFANKTTGAVGNALTERMRITSVGTVAINTTSSNAGYKLIVKTATDRNLGFGTQAGEFSIECFNDAISAGTPLRIYGSTIGLYGTIRLDSLGTGTVYSTGGTLSVVSDMTLKNDDGFIDNALQKVMNLKPRYFYWKEESKLPTDIRQLGFYAQEVNQSLGEEAANTPKENDKWGIYDRALIAMLTKAVQELKAEIDELKNK